MLSFACAVSNDGLLNMVACSVVVLLPVFRVSLFSLGALMV